MAKKEHITFTRQTAEILSNMAKDHIVGSSGIQQRDKPTNSVGKWVMKATTTITPCNYVCVDSGPSTPGFPGETPPPAEQSPIPGSGTAVICFRDDDGLLKIYKQDGVTASSGQVYSLLNEAIPAGRFFLATRDLAGTLWAEAVFHSCEPGSGGSGGGGSGPGSGSNCIDVVTDVRFDVYTCQLIVCTRNICFPPGTIIGPEDCGSGGSGG